MSKAGNYIVAAAFIVYGAYSGNVGLYQAGWQMLATPAVDGRNRERAAAKAANVEAQQRAAQVTA